MSPPPSVDDKPATPRFADAAASPPHPRVRARRRFWWLLGLTLVVGILCSPPFWHVFLRGLLVGEAARHGYTLTIGRIQGGPFDTIHFHEVRCRQPGPGTDVRVPNAELTLSWQIPWPSTHAPLAVQRLVFTGVNGHWDLAAPSGTTHVSARGPSKAGAWLESFAARLVPKEVFFQSDDFSVRRNRCQVRLRGLRLTMERNEAGLVLAREVEIAGPGFENTLLNRHAQTLWQGDRLTLSELDFSPGVRLVDATLDGSHLGHQRLDWEFTLAVMGGAVRAQGAVNFFHPRLALEVGGTLRRIPVAPLARLLGLAGPAGGSVEQGSFSFRGDPEDWPSAQIWLAAQATDFRWRQRDWQSLDLRATVLHRRIQVRRLELQQSRNRVSLTGDCPLLSAAQFAGRWWEPGFDCNVDVRLEDLQDLAQLFGARLPELDGRMSINGTLETRPGRPGIDGYLNVEGSRLRVGSAPLDYLHSTLLFRGNVLDVADLQATHGEDYFAGRGSATLAGDFRYDGDLHVAMSDPGTYAPALGGLVELAGTDGRPMRLDGIFYGPDTEGKAVFLTCGGLLRLPVPPTAFY